MSARVLFGILLVSTLAPASAAEPWSLVGCPPEGEARWQAFEHAVRTAKPGSTVYVPKPYPETPRQVIADYLYQYKSLHRERRGASGLPANEAPVVDGIMNQTVTFQVLRVANWTSMRCGTEKRRDFYYLVRVFDVASGVELTRAVIDQSGLFFMFSNLPEDKRAEPAEAQLRRLPEPAEAMARASARFKIQGRSPQYVTTYGTIDCDFADPCLAFQHGGSSYILSNDALFEVSAGGPKLTAGKDVGDPEKNAAILRSLDPASRLVSLGGPAWTIARQVDPHTLTGQP